MNNHIGDANKMVPAAAQEAVAGFGSIHDRGPLDLALADYEQEAINHGCTGGNAEAVDAAAERVWAVLQSAATVAAAPVDLHAAGLLHVLGATDFADASRIVGDMLALASTPAAPGIELAPFRELQQQLVSEAETAELNELEADSIGLTESANRQALRSKLLFNVAIRLGTLIDASPKGGENMRDWSLRMAKLEEGQHVGAGAHGLKDSPKGGGVAITDSDRIDLIAGEFLHIEPVEIRASEDDADVGWVISQRHMRKGLVELARWDNDNLRPAIDAAMQAISAEVGA